LSVKKKKKKKKKQKETTNVDVSAITLRAGAAENKLNRLPSLKDVKLFHPVQLTPPVARIWRDAPE